MAVGSWVGGSAAAEELFALVPGKRLGMAALVVSVVGSAFGVAAPVSLLRARSLRLRVLPDAGFLPRRPSSAA